MTLAEKLTHLNKLAGFSTFDVESKTDKAGERISGSYWNELCNGKKTNLSGKKALVLANLFKVPIRYLLDDSLNSPVEALELEASGLSNENLLQLIASLKQHSHA